MISKTKKIALAAIGSALLVGAAAIFVTNSGTKDSRTAYEHELNAHPYNNRTVPFSELKKLPRNDRPDLAAEHEFMITKDPSLGYPPTERLWKAHQVANQIRGRRIVPGTSSNEWVSRGPYNVGGRTRAILWDRNKENKVWAGGVSGGLWSIEDITDADAEWTQVNDFWANIGISCIDVDPNDPNTIYVGTGEGYGLVTRGNGIWKSTDGGDSWNQLESTIDPNTFRWVFDLKVHPTLGVFATTIFGGLWNSKDEGETWEVVLNDTIGGAHIDRGADIEFGADGTIYVSIGFYSAGNIYRSEDGVNFVQLNNGSNGLVESGHQRIEIATAPSDANVLYMLSEGAGGTAFGIWKSEDKGDTWTQMTEPDDRYDNGIPATDFTRGQANYDLILKVNPSDPNEIYTGGIDLFKSFDGGANWEILSNWSEQNAFVQAGIVPYVHADQHAMEFKPGSDEIMLFGNDGGVYFCDNAKEEELDIQMRNNNYVVTQFYAADLSPTAGRHVYVAGAQDNGSQYFDGQTVVDSTEEISGGDGLFCFADQSDTNFMITSYVGNVYFAHVNGNLTHYVLNDRNNGSFVNPADYDNDNQTLYSARTANTIYRIKNCKSSNPAVQTITVNALGAMASHLRVSPYSNTVFLGTGAGRILRVDDASTVGSGGVQISTEDIPVANISCIEIGASDDELLVTFSSYGVNSVWYTNNGGESWKSVEGNLPDMPIRWALFNPLNRSEVLLATEVGVWSTDDVLAEEVKWAPSNSGLANVRVDMLNYRTSDYGVVAATHGRGIFTGFFKSCALPKAGNILGDEAVCGGSTHIFSINEVEDAIDYQWTVPVDATIVDGQGSAEITVAFGNESGNVSVVAESSCGVGPMSSLPMEVVPIPARPEGIIGDRSTCEGASEVEYSIAALNGAESYTWSVPTDAIITSGQGTNAITVAFGTVSGDISVYGSNECGEGNPSSVEVFVGAPGAGPAITAGKTVIIPNETSVVFTCESREDALSYSWTIPEDATIVSGEGTASITVDFGVRSGDVCVAAETICGTSEITCQPAVVGGANCGLLVLEYPYVETFDQMDECENNCNSTCTLSDGWRNSSNDDMDWKTNSGGTPSSFTGPTGDVTGGGNYLYTEATGNCSPLGVAILESPCFNLADLTCPIIEFSYHMRGSQMGIMRLEVEDATSPNKWHTIEEFEGNKGNVWNKAIVSLDKFNHTLVRFRFTGITGSGFRSDMALDQIRVYDCNKEVPVFANCPNDMVACDGEASWMPPSVLGGVGNVTVTSNYNPGHIFGEGIHEVTYTAIDAAGNEATCSFDVAYASSPVVSSVDVKGASRIWRRDGAIDVTVDGGQDPYIYQWDNGEITEDISGLGIGAYRLVVTDFRGCNAQVNVFVGLGWARGGGVFDADLGKTEEISEAVELNVYPNPAADFVTISLNEVVSNQLSIEIIDMKGGAMMIEQQLPVVAGQPAQTTLDMSSLSAGEYIVFIRDGAHAYKESLILSK